jgi:hypothetical protein
MRFAIVLMTLALAAPATAGTSCPENIVWYGCWDGVGAPSTNASFDYGTLGSWSPGQTCNTGCYDLVSGTLVATGHGDPWGPGCSSRVLVHDDYQLVGPPGPALAFEAVLQVSGTMSGTGGYGAGLKQSWINPGEEQCSGAASCEASIALNYAPGSTFPVWAVLDAGATYPAGEAKATGLIRFRGLPEGYSVVSCQNYDVPVPAHALSWGGVKALYR